MSQSDYIKFLKTAQILQGEATTNHELPPVLTPTDYTAFESYNLETTVSNTKNSYSSLLPSANKRIFNIEKKVSTCPSFILCSNTNMRTNRVLNSKQLPTPTYIKSDKRLPTPRYPTFINSKVYTPSKCQIINGKVIRNVSCSKKICKCRTSVITNLADTKFHN